MLIGDIRKGHLFRDLPNQLVMTTMHRKQKFLDGLWRSSRSGSINKKILLENLHYLRNIVSAINKRCKWIDATLLPYATIFCKKPKSKSGRKKKPNAARDVKTAAAAAAGEASRPGDSHQQQQMSNIPPPPPPPSRVANAPPAAPDFPAVAAAGASALGNFTEMTENIWQFGLFP
ncbi:MAG: hypothetical protein GY862_34320 [Gammaproteobacteria bacterium]|nr:hypothetical protein [Gammaproteobacteria bacterium]